MRVVDDEAGARSHPLAGGDGAVVVVHAESGAEPDAAPAALVLQDAQGLAAAVEEGQEPAVLGSGVVVEAVGAPVGGPALGVGLLNEQVDACRGHVVDPLAERLLGDGIRQIPAGDAGWVADVDDGHDAAHRRTLACPAAIVGRSTSAKEASDGRVARSVVGERDRDHPGRDHRPPVAVREGGRSPGRGVVLPDVPGMPG